MSEKTIEDYKVELNDKVEKLVRDRNDIIIKAEEINKQLHILMEQQLALDDSKIKIKCLQCGGKGWVDAGDGKKIVCQVCSGLEYLWAEKYTEVKK